MTFHSFGQDRLADLANRWDRNQVIALKLKHLGARNRKDVRTFMAHMTEKQKDGFGQWAPENADDAPRPVPNEGL